MQFFIGRFGPCLAYQHIYHRRIQTWGENFIAKIDYTGQISFDFIEEPDGRLVAIECNPRSTSGVHLFTKREQLPSAFFGTTDHVITPHPKRYRQITLAMLLFGWVSALWQKKILLFLKHIYIGRDALFRWSAPCHS